ncbi:MAG: hypothetical protein GY719_26460 [bacterium]|nr:hypothetical protein [bacterium]
MDRSRSLLPLMTLAAIGLFAATAAGAAKRLKAPTLMMMGKYQQVAVAMAEQSSEEDTVQFKRKKVLYGKMPKRVTARLDAETGQDLVWGRSYIIAYTEVRRNPLDRDSPERDPDGPKVVTLPVIGAAVIEDTPEIRFLFEAARDGEKEPGRDYLDAILTQLARPDIRTRKFVIAELYMRPRLLDHLQEADLPAIRAVAGSSEIDTEVRSFLLESSTRFPSSLRGALADVASEIVEEAKTELDLSSTHPLLVKTSLQVLETAGADADAALVGRHFDSNSPGVAKAALSLLRTLDDEAAARRAREVLSRSDLHQTTRRAMEQFLEQHGEGGG